MKKPQTIIAIAALGWLVSAAVHADAIQKWRTPDGSLYFGDRPPAGSVLLETFPDSPPALVAAPAVNGLAQAAAEGREIIKRREAERADVRKEEADLALRETAVENERPTVVVVNAGRPCAFGEPCFFGRRHHRHPWSKDDGFHRQPPPFERPVASPPAPLASHSATWFAPRRTRSPGDVSLATFR